MSIQSLEIRTLVSMKNMKQKKMVIQPLYLFSQPVRELVHIYLKIKKAQAMHRLYVPLKGKGLREAEGENNNPFFQVERIKRPLISKKICPQYPLLYRVYEYDVMTEPGKSYCFERI